MFEGQIGNNKLVLWLALGCSPGPPEPLIEEKGWSEVQVSTVKIQEDGLRQEKKEGLS